eukprot:m.26264 g.26264  ORF g.26264 m.26264 type:complete len:84 (+) comp9254_c0_seq1:370-621(+)
MNEFETVNLYLKNKKIYFYQIEYDIDTYLYLFVGIELSLLFLFDELQHRVVKLIWALDLHPVIGVERNHAAIFSCFHFLHPST